MAVLNVSVRPLPPETATGTFRDIPASARRIEPGRLHADDRADTVMWVVVRGGAGQ